MRNGTTKRKLDLLFHPADFDAIERASRLAKIETSEFCKLAIHIAARKTIAGSWPLSSSDSGAGMAGDVACPNRGHRHEHPVLACENQDIDCAE
ncbi:hypothetical protein [Burkholderia vietnamiensis]|uniref:hypothetical protein n=1 Tax=Burkholderia vietnamiensis TaxID=60552 RepID=UPI0015948F44|nr:hypothetical protein [Burkholderia vietnamiensis]MCA8270697.1 hypothetical protein [Burkholderia vietnamiensis]